MHKRVILIYVKPGPFSVSVNQFQPVTERRNLDHRPRKKFQVLLTNKGPCTYYVITDRGVSFSKWLQYYIGGGLAKWLQYYIGVVRQMITVLIRRGGLANDYGIPWILGYYIRNIISKDLTKKKTYFFQLVKSHFWEVCQNDYNFT